MKTTNKLYLIVGPTGVGKNSVINELLKKTKSLKILPSYTNRKIRENEKERREHFFVTKNEFDKLIKENKLAEYEEVHPGLFYGVALDKTLELLKKNNLIKDIDVLGAQSLKKIFKDNVVIIFIKPPSLKELKNRVKNRGGLSEKEIKERLARVDFEMKQQNKSNYQIVNDKLKDCVNQVFDVIQKN